MDDEDLKAMEIAELRSLRSSLDRAILAAEERNRKAALAAIEEAAREHGFSAHDLLSRGKKAAPSKGGGAAPRYANPFDASQTWSGRGRRPDWVREALLAGGQMEDFLIDNPLQEDKPKRSRGKTKEGEIA